MRGLYNYRGILLFGCLYLGSPAMEVDENRETPEIDPLIKKDS